MSEHSYHKSHRVSAVAVCVKFVNTHLVVTMDSSMLQVGRSDSSKKVENCSSKMLPPAASPEDELLHTELMCASVLQRIDSSISSPMRNEFEANARSIDRLVRMSQ